MNHDLFWHQKLPNIILMPNTYFNLFLELNNMTILAKMLVPYRKTKSQLIQHFYMVHPRDILLTESWGSSGEDFNLLKAAISNSRIFKFYLSKTC